MVEQQSALDWAQLQMGRASEMKRCCIAALVLCTFITASAAPDTGRCDGRSRFRVHERQCDAYYRCENGVMMEELCPEGLVFDDRLQRCDLPRDVDCGKRPVLQPSRPSAHCPHLNGVFTHETDCARFWMCMDGTAHPFSCPLGLAYDDVSGRCEWPDLVSGCNSEAVVGFRCPGSSVRHSHADPRYPYPGDCQRFYMCVSKDNGGRMPRLLFCDKPLVFDPRSGTCEKPEGVTGCQSYYGEKQRTRIG